MSTRTIGFLPLGVLGLGLAGCGAAEVLSALNAASPVIPTRTVIGQGSGQLAAPSAAGATFGLVAFTTSASGTIEARVDWTFPTNTLWIYLTQGACTTTQFQNPDCPRGPSCPCQIAVSSETATPKPRVLSLPGAAAGSRSLIVVNLGPREEAISYEISLTR